MADFKQIDEARKVLGLDEDATLKEIKDSFRKLSLKYHPDKCKEKDKKNCEKVFKKINNANEVLMTYCINYRFSFNEDKAQGVNMDKEFKEHAERFYEGWV